MPPSTASAFHIAASSANRSSCANRNDTATRHTIQYGFISSVCYIYRVIARDAGDIAKPRTKLQVYSHQPEFLPVLFQPLRGHVLSVPIIDIIDPSDAQGQASSTSYDCSCSPKETALYPRLARTGLRYIAWGRHWNVTETGCLRVHSWARSISGILAFIQPHCKIVWSGRN